MRRIHYLSMLLAASVLLLTACDSKEETEPVDGPDGPEQPQGPDDPNKPVTPDFTPEAWYQTNYWERTDREKEGLRGPVKQWRITTYASYTLVEYDRAGHLLKESEYDNSGELSTVTTYTYDSEGRRIKSVVKNGEGDYTYEETTYEYGNPGKLVCSQAYLGHNWALVGLTGRSEALIPGLSAMHILRPDIQHDRYDDYTYTFDAEGNLSINERSYTVDKFNDNQVDESSISDQTYRWIYQNGYPYATDPDNPTVYGITAITWQPNGMPLTWDSKIKETTYTYMGEYRIDHCEWFENDRVLDFKDFQHEEGYVGSWLADYWRKKEFDEHQELTHMMFDVFNEGSSFDYYYTDYVYDAHGNWISHKEDTTGILDGSRSVTTVEREIVYF